MRKYIHFTFLLCTILTILNPSQVLAAALDKYEASLVPLHIQDPGIDIPSFGSSAFDKLFFNEAKRSYQVPFPIGKLVDEIVIKSSESKPKNDYYPGAFHSYFPFSRSLQRPVDLSFDPLLSPRMVFTLSNSENILADNKFFWAYVKARDQLEVISYNEEAGRFEFQIIKNYSKNPEVYYAPRAKCMTCHQGQAPILSVNPWEDSGTKESKMSMALYRAQAFPAGTDPKALTEKLIGSSKTLDSVGSLDHSVRAAEELTNFQRLYVHACQTRECRLSLLLRAFERLDDCQKIAPFNIKCESLLQIVKASPLAREQYASSRLSQGPRQFMEILESLTPEVNYLDSEASILATSRFANSKTAKLQMVDALKSLNRDDNPATSRYESIFDPRYNSLFNVQIPDLRFSFLKTVMPNRNSDAESIAQIQQSIIKLYANGSSVFDEKALNLIQLEKEIQTTLGLTKPKVNLGYRRSLDIRNYAKVFSDSTVAIYSNPNLNKIAKNCGACHQNSEGYPNPFLVGSEDQVEANIRSLKDKMLDRIQNQIMPPTEELQNKFLNSEDRDRIIKYLEAL